MTSPPPRSWTSFRRSKPTEREIRQGNRRPLFPCPIQSLLDPRVDQGAVIEEQPRNHRDHQQQPDPPIRGLPLGACPQVPGGEDRKKDQLAQPDPTKSGIKLDCDSYQIGLPMETGTLKLRDLTPEQEFHGIRLPLYPRSVRPCEAGKDRRSSASVMDGGAARPSPCPSSSGL